MPVSVLGFEIPEEIARVARDETWTAYTEEPRLAASIVETVFGEAPDSTWKFYSLEELRLHTEDWRRLEDPTWFGVEPDNVDPAQAVLIGDLGYERPFALDYRGGTPVVRFMTIEDRWVKIADSSSALLCALGIEHTCEYE